MTMPVMTDRIDLVEAIEFKAETLKQGLFQAYKIKGSCINVATPL